MIFQNIIIGALSPIRLDYLSLLVRMRLQNHDVRQLYGLYISANFHRKSQLQNSHIAISMSLSPESPDSPNSDPVLALTRPRYIAWMYNLDKLGVEARGIERVPPNERLHATWSQYISVLGLWFAGCGGLTTMLSFFLPTIVYGLSMNQALVSGLIGLNIGCFVPAYCLTMGPKSGCRQMVTARFVFGHYGVKFVAAICILGGIGWLVVNCVVGGQILAAISDVSLDVGIVVISVGSLVVGVFGIRVLLKFQTVVAVPTNLAIVLLYIVVCKKTNYISQSDKQISDLNYSSETVTGLWLSFLTLAYSVTATWGLCASDYYILFPETTPDWKIFMLTYFGIAVPLNFAAVVGLLAGNIAYLYTPWTEAYDKYGIGGVVAASFEPWGNFGKFVVVVLFLLLVCNTIINTYSAAFEFQLIGQKLAVVPRWVWATFISVAYLVISLAGKENLLTIISNVLALLGYWISMYITILLEENLLFRRAGLLKLHSEEFENENENENENEESEGSSEKDRGEEIFKTEFEKPPVSQLYNWSRWDLPANITLGLASSLSFCIGVVGAVLGMNQVYFIGPISKLIGDFGGDIGMWLCMGFTGVTYPPLRAWELKKFRR